LLGGGAAACQGGELCGRGNGTGGGNTRNLSCSPLFFSCSPWRGAYHATARARLSVSGLPAWRGSGEAASASRRGAQRDKGVVESFESALLGPHGSTVPSTGPPTVLVQRTSIL
ncbi:hypothetical protein BAE44_0014002, partial [Dichanthelium oligosanthes]